MLYHYIDLNVDDTIVYLSVITCQRKFIFKKFKCLCFSFIFKLLIPEVPISQLFQLYFRVKYSAFIKA